MCYAAVGTRSRGFHELRFSIVFLLLILPAWIIAYLISSCVTFEGARVTYRHDVAASDIRAVRLWATNQMAAKPEIQFTEYDADDLWRQMGRNRDPWENEYQIVERGQRGLFGSDSAFHVYSFGADGKSESGGNDPDDINSWDYDRDMNYGRLLVAESNLKDLWRTLWIVPAVYVILLFVVQTFKSSPNRLITID